MSADIDFSQYRRKKEPENKIEPIEADIQASFQESPDEIDFSQYKREPERTNLEKAGRLATQFGIGTAENALLGYEIGVLPLALPGGQEALGDLFTKDVLSEIYPSEEEGKQISPRELREPINLGVRGLLEKATGLDLHPEGFLEKAVGWLGFLKDPKKGYQAAKDISKLATSPKEVLKIVAPGTKTLRSLGAAEGLQLAEDGQLGPLGTITAAVIGDIVGHTPKGIKYIVQNPKEVIAGVTDFVTMNKNKKMIAKQISEDFKKSGLTVDAGTLTQSPLVQMIQARVAQSGLSGEAQQNFMQNLSQQIVREYSGIMDQIGEIRFENNFQASEAIKDALRVQEVNLNIPKGEPSAGRSLAGRISTEGRPGISQEDFLSRIAPEFESSAQGGQNLKTAANDIKTPIKEVFDQRWQNLNQQIAEIPATSQRELGREMRAFVRDHEGSLLMGESTAEHRVVRAAQQLEEQLLQGQRGIPQTLDALIKTKRTLQDIANYEFGGSNFESAYKNLVGRIDEAIERTIARENPGLLNEWMSLNGEYSAFKDMFENKNVMPLFEPKNENYNAMLNSFVSNPDKLRSLEDIFHISPRGNELIAQVKRDYAQKVLSNPNITARQIRDLGQILGPEYAQDLENFAHRLEYDRAHPLPRVRRGQPIGTQARIVPVEQGKPISGRAKETGVERANIAARKKMYKYLSNKSDDQIMKQMDTIHGIRELKKVLELTPEGKKLFKDLARYKLEEMIGKKMKDSISEQVKLGKFSHLLESTQNKAIVKELIGNNAYQKLELLQRNANRLSTSINKFYNASKSGTTMADIGVITTGMLGVITGNPFLIGGALGTVGGTRILSSLLADPVFLGLLEKAIIENDPKKFLKILQKMEPNIQKAVLDAKTINENQREEAI